ncbi:MAG: DUF3604 domain-containing protein [Verrucomicrobiales bacterium]|nr:DUF3604 domain-containing protein [Verrucomicrobiales bacterium]
MERAFGVRQALAEMTLFCRTRFATLLVISIFGNGGSEEPVSEEGRWSIDTDQDSFNTEMQVVITPPHPPIAYWKSYRDGKEKILRRVVLTDGSGVNPVEPISEGATAFMNLSTGVLHAPARHRISWSERSENGDWEVVTRRYHAEAGLEGERRYKGIYSDAGFDAPLLQRLETRAKSAIYRLPGTEAAGRDAELVEETGDRISSRPVGVGGWLFWDQYFPSGDSRIMGIVGTGLSASKAKIVASDPGTRCLKPVAIASSNEGVCVAWIKLTDVIGGEGVIDMLHTAHVARIIDGEVTPVVDEKGNDEAAVFLNGLLPDLRPGKGYPSGYSGNRRHPMLLDSGDGVWLLWERKSKHSGGGTKTAGQLLGRKFVEGKWTTGPMLIHEGLIDYRLAVPHRVVEGDTTFYLVGSEIPRSWKRPSHLLLVDITKAVPIKLDDWREQFEPVSLPLSGEPERYETEGSDGKRYRLFWGDLHCHSGLTGDAEGEPDEIVLYARDRAKLDVMVLQDNDEVHGRILTEGEYRLGTTYSQWITEPGRFVALPGYEWTQRTMKGGVPDPYASVHEQKMKGSYPNHRTVIYPMKGGPIVRYFEVGHDFDRMAETVAASGGILHSQHPAFELSDQPNEVNLEVTACWGIYIRSVPALFHGELDKGRRVGFIGTSDSHRRNPGLCGGLTGIYAEELTPEAIFDALKKHRVFATNGSKIVLDSRADGKLSDHVVKARDGSVNLSLSITGTTPVTDVRLIGTGGKTVAKFPGNGTKEFYVEKALHNLPSGNHWFYWAVEQEGTSRQYSGNISVAQGNLAWSSPHFVEVAE